MQHRKQNNISTEEIMESLKGKVVFITGASSGIGKACAYQFAEAGANLIISARRLNMINEIAENIKSKYSVEVFAFRLDVRNKNEVFNAINSLDDRWKNIDILVNNAGLAKGLAKLYEDDPDNWESMIDTNVKGLLYVTRAIVPLMVQRKSGHVINIGSIAGRVAYPNGSVYCATKHAVLAINNSLRMDLIDKNIRVSTVDPGMVETDFSNIRFNGDKEKAKHVYRGLKPLTADDIADTVLFCASRPSHINISEVVITPTAQANAFVAYREN